MKILIGLLFLYEILLVQSDSTVGKQCYVCVGTPSECGQVPNPNAEIKDCAFNCATYLLHLISDNKEDGAIVARQCDNSTDCNYIGIADYGNFKQNYKSLRIDCADTLCNKETFNEDDVFTKADTGSVCNGLRYKRDEGAEGVSSSGATTGGAAAPAATEAPAPPPKAAVNKPIADVKLVTAVILFITSSQIF